MPRMPVCVKQASCLLLGLREGEGRVCPAPKGVTTVQCFGHAKLMERLGSPRTHDSRMSDRDRPPQPCRRGSASLITPWSQAISLTSDKAVNQTVTKGTHLLF